MTLKETLQCFLENKTTEKIFMINAHIFSVIIGEILWESKYVEGQMYANMMTCFMHVGDNSEALQSG